MSRRIGVNLMWLRPGRVGGTETYATRLLRALADARSVEIHLFALPSFSAAHPDLADAFPTHIAPLPTPARPLRVAAEATWLAGAAARRRLELLHHAGGTVPPVRTVPSVVTIHDLQYLTYPATFSALKLAFLSRVVPQAVRSSRVVTTTSEYVRRRVIEAFDIPADRVAIVPPVAEEPPGQPREPADVAARFGVRPPYFLYPTAASYPFKNHSVLLHALTKARGASLVFTGQPWATDAALTSLAAELGVSDRVHHVGYLDSGDLDALYRGAVAVLFPSLYEGFGMGALEAMSRGCPVVAADTTALPDTVGRGGTLLPAEDAGAWAAEMLKLIDDPNHRRVLGERARARATDFDAAGAARAQLAAYELALSRRPGSSQKKRFPAL